jgi:AcrR family transcriptional regulator
LAKSAGLIPPCPGASDWTYRFDAWKRGQRGAAASEPEPAPIRRAAAQGRESRVQQGALTRERIVRTAMEIADAEGLGALSMRRIAAELGVAAMSLYRHVSGKDELVLLIIDAAFGEVELPDPMPRGWRARLELAARWQWELYHRHPWAAREVSLTRPVPAPNAMAHTEWTLRAIDGLGLDPVNMLHVAVTIAGFVRGTAASLAAEVEARADTGVTDEQWLKSADSPVAMIAGSDAYPLLAAVPPGSMDLDTLFEFGLRRILDGVAALVDPPAP